MKQAIQKARKRDIKGKYIQTTENGWKAKQHEYRKEHLKTHPWTKFYMYSKGRAKKRDYEHTLCVADIKVLWFRDEAFKLKAPSIDRINPNKGYIQGNCRFIERSLNSSLGNKGLKKIKVCPNCGWHNYETK